jgi:hypothetical protein
MIRHLSLTAATFIQYTPSHLQILFVDIYQIEVRCNMTRLMVLDEGWLGVAAESRSCEASHNKVLYEGWALERYILYSM